MQPVVERHGRIVGGRPTCALLLLLSACGPSGPVDGAAAMRHVEAMVAIGPRPFGSEALGRTADYIQGELQKIGLTLQRQEVMDQKEQKLIRNLYVQIDGADPQAGPVLVIGAHYDTKLAEGHADQGHNFRFVGAIDGGGGPAVLIELARVLKQRQPKPAANIWLYWIDAEESIDFAWNNARSLLGSKAFCKWLVDQKQKDRIKAFVLLDLIGDKKIKIDRDGNSNEELQRIFEKAAKDIGESARVFLYPRQYEIEQYKQQRRSWGITDDHMTFRDFGIPSVLLIDFAHRIPPHLQELQRGEQPRDPEGHAQWWHTDQDTPDKMAPQSLAFAGNLVVAALAELEAFVLKHR